MTDVNETTVDQTTQDNTDVSTDTQTETDDLMNADTSSDQDSTDTGDDDGLMDGSASEDEKAEEEKPAKEGAPEDYGEFKIRDGYELSDDNYKSFTEFCKKQGLNKEQAQAVLDYHADLIEGDEAGAKEADKKQIQDWISEARQIHGDKYPEVLAGAKKVWKSDIVPDGFRTLMKGTTLNNNPHVLQLLFNISTKISEDAFVPSENKVKGKNEGGLNSMFSDLNKKT